MDQALNDHEKTREEILAEEVALNESNLFRDLSDAEFLDTAPAEFLDEDNSPDTEELTNKLNHQKTEETEVPSDTQEGSDAQEQTDIETSQDEVSQPEGDTQTEHETSIDSDVTESLDTSKKDSTDTKEDTPETTEFDYESAYKKVSEPFKANGTRYAG